MSRGRAYRAAGVEYRVDGATGRLLFRRDETTDPRDRLAALRAQREAIDKEIAKLEAKLGEEPGARADGNPHTIGRTPLRRKLRADGMPVDVAGEAPQNAHTVGRQPPKIIR